MKTTKLEQMLSDLLDSIHKDIKKDTVKQSKLSLLQTLTDTLGHVIRYNDQHFE